MRKTPVLIFIFILLSMGAQAYAETLTFENGSYQGQIKDGVPHGQGSLDLSDGASYVGGFKKGMRHGFGTSITSDGQKWTGEFAENKQHGQGTYSWPTGERFIGEMRQSAFWLGTTFHSNGEVFGHYRDGIFESLRKSCEFGESIEIRFELRGVTTNGRYRTCEWPGGDVYIGPWKGNAQHGMGQYEFSTGAVYYGRFHFGMATGYGRIEWPDGSSQDGFFLDGRPYGVSRYQWSTGEEEIGFFDAGFVNSIYFNPEKEPVLVTRDGSSDESKQLVKVEQEGTRISGQVDEQALNGITTIMSTPSLFDGDGRIFIGRVKNNQPDGFGISAQSNPFRIFIGQFLEGIAYDGFVYDEVWTITDVVTAGVRKSAVSD